MRILLLSLVSALATSAAVAAPAFAQEKLTVYTYESFTAEWGPGPQVEKAFEAAGLRPASRLPAAMELGETSLAFLVHPTLTTDEVDKTAETAAAVLRLAEASA